MKLVSCECDAYKSPCFLKTGTRDGPNKGKSFYICSNTVNRCNFTRVAPKIQPMMCRVHSLNMVDLQCRGSSSSGENGLYFRCEILRNQGKHGWCGYLHLNQDGKENQTEELPISSQQGTGKQVRSAKSTDASAWDGNAQVQKETMSTQGQLPASVVSHMQAKLKPDAPTVDCGGNTSLSFADLSSVQPPMVRNKLLEHLKQTTSLNDSASSYRDSSHMSVDIASDDSSDDGDSGRDRDDGDSGRDHDDGDSGRDRDDGDSGRDRDDGDIGRDRDDGDGDVRYHDDGDDSRDCDNDGGNHDDAYSAGEAEADSAYMSRSTASTNTKGDSFSDDSGCVFIKEISSTSHQPHSEDKAPPPGVVGSSSRGTITVKSVTQNDRVTGKPETTKGSDGVAAVSRGDKRPPMAISQYNQTLMSKSQLLLQQQQMQKRMDDKKRLFHCAGKGLPDGGKKLLDDIDELQRGISAIALRVPHALESVPTAAGKVSSKVETANMVAQQSGNSLQPLILTHAVPLPPHVFQQMYGDNPQLNTLYDGGRMNAARRREVAAVTADAIEKLHRSIQTCPAETDELEDPAGLKVRLMVHQRQALSWLTWREKQQPPSGILADDMGLGKTLTMISLVLKQKKAKVEDEEAATAEWFDKTKAKGLVRSGGTLIIAPASLVHQWHKEIERHCNRGLLKVLLYHGPNREKSVRMIASHDVVLTTYTIVGREVGRGQQESADDPAQDEPDAAAATGSSSTQPTLLRVAWERIVLDEGHSIKNHKSLSAMAACRLRAAHRWVVTGTPIQNNLLDMYALLRFLRCSPFDEYKVWKRWVDNKSAQSTKRLSTLVKALLLRRTKDQKGTCGEPLVSLPTRTAILHKVTLNKDEKAIYDQVFSKSKQTMENYLKKHEEAAENRDASSHGGVRPPNPFVSASQLYSQTSGGSTTAVPDNKTSGTYILVLLLRLRQCCNHLSLLKDGIDTETSENEGIEMDVAEHMKDLHIDGVAAPPDAPAGGATASSSRAALFLPRYVSTKVAAVLTQLADIKQQSPPGQPAKSVIVSQWTSMLRVMQEHLEQHGYRTCSIQGNVPPRKRADLVESFNTDPRGPEIMLLSLKAGGVGLNLIGGNNLFMMDMHWNPALESQACDRVYRVGQLKDVTIHKFVCAGTVEEKIQKLQQRKMSLANDVLTGGKIQSQKLTLTDLKMLFDIK